MWQFPALWGPQGAAGHTLLASHGATHHTVNHRTITTNHHHIHPTRWLLSLVVIGWLGCHHGQSHGGPGENSPGVILVPDVDRRASEKSPTANAAALAAAGAAAPPKGPRPTVTVEPHVPGWHRAPPCLARRYDGTDAQIGHHFIA